MWIRFVFALLLIASPTFAANLVYSVPICSSSAGTEITGGIQKSMLVSAQSGASTTVFVASLDDCANLTSGIGAPLNAVTSDAAISFNGKVDGNGKYCAILKTGSTCVNVGVNMIGD